MERKPIHPQPFDRCLDSWELHQGKTDCDSQQMTHGSTLASPWLHSCRFAAQVAFNCLQIEESSSQNCPGQLGQRGFYRATDANIWHCTTENPGFVTPVNLPSLGGKSNWVINRKPLPRASASTYRFVRSRSILCDWQVPCSTMVWRGDKFLLLRNIEQALLDCERGVKAAPSTADKQLAIMH